MNPEPLNPETSLRSRVRVIAVEFEGGADSLQEIIRTIASAAGFQPSLPSTLPSEPAPPVRAVDQTPTAAVPPASLDAGSEAVPARRRGPRAIPATSNQQPTSSSQPALRRGDHFCQYQGRTVSIAEAAKIAGASKPPLYAARKRAIDSGQSVFEVKGTAFRLIDLGEARPRFPKTAMAINPNVLGGAAPLSHADNG
jgi:hypothetical protein